MEEDNMTLNNNMKNTTRPIPLVLPSVVWLDENDSWLEPTLTELKYVKTQQKKGMHLFVHPDHDNNAHKLVLNTTSQTKFFSQINEPFGIVTVGGPLRSGKSTLLSLLIRRLEGKTGPASSDGTFKCSDESISCTVGLWVYPKLFTVGENKILLVDSEGLYSIDELNGRQNSDDYFSKLMLLSSLLSSVIAYNLSLNMAISQRELQELARFCASLQSVHKSLQEAFLTNYPNFVLIARNYNREFSYQQDQKEWQITKRSSNFREISKWMDQSFRDNYFFTFPDAATDSIPEHKNIVSYPFDQLRASFVAKLDEFINLLGSLNRPMAVQSDTTEVSLPNGVTFLQVVERLLPIVQANRELDLEDILDLMRDGQRMKYVQDAIEAISKEFTVTLPVPEANLKHQFGSLLQQNSISQVLEEICSIQRPRSGKTATITDSASALRFIHDQATNTLLASVLERNTEESRKLYATHKEAVVADVNQAILTVQSEDQLQDIINNLPSRILAQFSSSDVKLLPGFDQFVQEVTDELKKALDDAKRDSQAILVRITLKVATQSLEILKMTALDGLPVAPLQLPADGDPSACILSQVKDIINQHDFNLTVLQNLRAQQAPLKGYQESYLKKMKNIPPLYHRKDLQTYLENFCAQIAHMVNQIPGDAEKAIISKTINKLLVPTVLQSEITWTADTLGPLLQTNIASLFAVPNVNFMQILQTVNEKKNTVISEALAIISRMKFPPELQFEARIEKIINSCIDILQKEFPSPVCQLMVTSKTARTAEQVSSILSHTVGLKPRYVMETPPNKFIVTLMSAQEVEKVISLQESIDPDSLDFAKYEFDRVVFDPVEESAVEDLKEVIAFRGGSVVSLERTGANTVVVLMDKVHADKLVAASRVVAGGTVIAARKPVQLEINDLVTSEQQLKKALPVQPIAVISQDSKWILQFASESDAATVSATKLFDTFTISSPKAKTPVKKNMRASLNNNLDDPMDVDSSNTFEPYLKQCTKISNVHDYLPKDYANLFWDSKIFLEYLNHHSNRITHGNAHHHEGTCGARIVAQMSTLAAIDKGSYYTDEGTLVPIEVRQSRNLVMKDNLAELNHGPFYPETLVRIVPSDCVHEAMNQIEQGKRVMMLNMANSKTLGGGWEKGRSAQEEDLFRRSDYCKKADTKLYPISEFGGILTENVAFFRGTENAGYPFLPKVYFIDCLAVAAYNVKDYPDKPIVQHGEDAKMKTAFLVRTRRKLETIFRAGMEHKYDTLVLSALGCGAFDNPPTDIAAAFRSVIEQYAGFVKEVIFAILPGKPTKTSLLDVFRKEITSGQETTSFPSLPQLTGKDFPALVSMGCFRTFSSPKETCEYGCRCTDLINPDHLKSLFHGPSCPLGENCQMANHHHSTLLMHITPCPKGSFCEFGAKKIHRRWFTHPPHCPQNNACTIISKDHLESFWHLPVCDEGLNCKKYTTHDQHHCFAYRHLVQACPKGGNCRRYYDSGHLATYSHPFKTPCWTPLYCHQALNKKHMEQYAHFCEWGGSCKKKDDKEHCLLNIHVVGHNCPHQNCHDFTEDHLSTFSHPGIKDIRPLCRDGAGCPDITKVDHVKEFAHPESYKEVPVPIFPSILVEVDYNNSKSQNVTNNRVTFYHNVHTLRKHLEDYLKKVPSLKDHNFQKIVRFVSNLRPVHRCNAAVLMSVLEVGALLSRDKVYNLNTDDITDMVFNHPDTKKVIEMHFGLRSTIRHFIYYSVLLEKAEIEKKKPLDPSNPTTKPWYSTADLTNWSTQQLQFERTLLNTMKEDNLKLIKVTAKKMTGVVCDMQTKNFGVGYHVDQIIGTHRTVFSVMGPHHGDYGKIRVILSPQIKYHPDFFMLPCAATFFHSNRYYQTRPWTGITQSDWAGEGHKQYSQSKFHPIAAGMDEVLALELVANVMFKFKKTDPTSITLKDVKSYIAAIDSHYYFEGHLPTQVPVQFIDHIVMSKEIYDTLSDDDRKKINSICKPIVTKDETESQKISNKLASPGKQAQEQTGFVFLLQPERSGHGLEVNVPLKAIDGKAMNIYFKARGRNFFIFLFDNDASPIKQTTYTIFFQVDQQQEVYISDQVPAAHVDVMRQKGKKLHSVQNFNQGLDTKKYIHYCVSYDAKAGTITVDHWGPSKVYCLSKKLVFQSKTRLSPKVQYFACAVWDEPVMFAEVSLKKDLVPSPFQEKKKQKASVPAHGTNNNNNSTSSSSNNNNNTSIGKFIGSAVNTVASTVAKMFSADNNNNDPSLPMCKYDKRCEMFHMEKKDSPIRKQHSKEFKHTCLYGKACNSINDPIHAAQCEHENNPDCQFGKQCTKLQDPDHRARFHHAELWAFMIPCKFRSACTIQESTHKLSYYHH